MDTSADSAKRKHPSSSSSLQNGVSSKKLKVSEQQQEEGEEKRVNEKEIGLDLSEGGRDVWMRKPVPNFDPAVHSMAFQQIDCDYYVGGLPGQSVLPHQKAPIIRMFGLTESGNSIVAFITGFKPYFYVPIWPGFDKQNDLKKFSAALNDALASSNQAKGYINFVTECRLVEKQSVWGYHFGKKETFMRICTAIPRLVATARRILENGLMIPGMRSKAFLTYESNIPFALRFMIDKDIRGGGWVELPAGSYNARVNDGRMGKPVAKTQIEVETDWKSCIVHNDVEGEWLKLAPIRILSFDIECAGRKGHFPEAKQDPVIQIANVVTIQGQDHPIVKNIFCLKKTALIAGAHVMSFQYEKDLLMHWSRFVTWVDPDILTGYNIINFDLPYLLERAEALKLDQFPYIGRMTAERSRAKAKTFSSKAYGTRESKEINIAGRVQFDLLPVIQRNYKLRSYSLNAVSAHFLKQQKEDVHYSIITDLQNGSPETRRRLAIYCLKDARLPQKLLDKLMLIINYVEMARVTGVPINYLLIRGQQIKVVSQLYRKANSKHFIIPVRPKIPSDEQYEGATVIEPLKGYYTQPIATLDFASLYPSIMMAHNLCYTTLVTNREDLARLREDQYTKTPRGDYFVNQSTQIGILPEILDELLSARKRAKKDMKQAKDPFKKAVLNGRQLALKVSANSVYGFTGALVGSLPCIAISASVTSFGREMIDETKSVTEENFTIANGYEHDAVVVYGDTDSVMIKFGTTDIKEAMDLGRKAAEIVSGRFKKPIKLEFEKVYKPYLLMAKKRYAGMLYTTPEKFSYMDAKGIETVRRDSCALVKDVIQKCLNMILIDEDTNAAIKYTKTVIRELLQNKVDMSSLVISKSLGKSIDSDDYKAKLAHVELARRMRDRDPATAPSVGDRVAYVITKGVRGAPQYEKAEDPIHVLETGLAIDTQHYLEHQLKQPLERIFEPIIGDVSKLLVGDHTRSITISTPNVGGLMKFAVRSEKCLGCNVKLEKTEKTLCKYCRPKQSQIYMQRMEKLKNHEKDHSKFWIQCQQCQDQMHTDILCSNRDCPIFYRRTKSQKDLEEAQRTLNKFSF